MTSALNPLLHAICFIALLLGSEILADDIPLLMPEQEWTNAQGKKLMGAVVRLQGDKVIFLIGQKEVAYSMAKLSTESQATINAQVREQQSLKKPETQKVKLLCVRANFVDRQILADNDSLWRERIQALVAYAEPYYQFQSHGKISSISIEITPVYQFPNSWSDFKGKEGELADAMRQLASDDHWDVSAYDHVVLSFPTIDGSYGALGSPGTIWMPGENPWPPGFAHEVGHAFGMGHANTWEGGDKSWPGIHDEGSDANFTMGSGEVGAAWNLPMKVKCGWIDSARVMEVLPGRKIYRIWQSDSETLHPTGSLGLVANDFWISYAPHQSHWMKDGVPRTVVQNGVFIHTFHGSHTRLVDATPNSRSNPDRNQAALDPFHDTKDAALTIGSPQLELDNSSSYPGYKVAVKPINVGKGKFHQWIDVEVELTPESSDDELLAEESFETFNLLPGAISNGIGWERNWQANDSNAKLTYNSSGLKYENLKTTAGGLTLKASDDEGDTLLISRELKRTIGAVNSQIWVAMLVRANNQQVGDLLLSFGDNRELSFGKPWGDRFGVFVTHSNRPFINEETNLLVIQLKFDRGEGTAKMWLNPSLEKEPMDESVIAERKSPFTSTNILNVNVQGYGHGEYQIDELRIGASYHSVIPTLP